MPLIISEADGTVIYKSLSLKDSEAERIVFSALSLGKESGFVSLEGRNVIIKKKLFCGANRLFYMDIDRYSEDTKWFEDAFSKEKREVTVPLETLTRIFARACEKEKGISLSVRNLAKEYSAKMPLGAVIMCLSLMVRFFSVKGAAVSLEAVRRDGDVTFLVDGTLGSAPDSALTLDMLYEIAYENGLGIEILESGERITLALMLSPADISEYGFKADDFIFTERLCEVCIDLVL